MADVQQRRLLPDFARKKLEENNKYIYENMDRDFMEGLMASLYQERFVTYAQYEEFRDREGRVDAQKDKVMGLLFRGSLDLYKTFVDYCKEELPEMHDRLDITEYDARPREQPGDDLDGGQADINRSQRNISPPACLTTNEEPIMNVDVVPVYSATVLSMVHKYQSVYATSAPVRGVALLIVNYVFNNSKFPTRYGVDYDMKNLGNLYHQLGYNVRILLNTSRADLLLELRKLQTDESLASHGSFVLGMSTHGEDGFYVCSDGEKIYLSELLDYLDSVHCPYLAGRPKLLFFDGSSGFTKDRGVPLDQALIPAHYPKPLRNSFPLDDLYKHSVDIPTFKKELITFAGICRKPVTKIPVKSDFILAMSTYEGHVSWRRQTHGCWFSRVMVEVFQKYACDYDVTELLQLVRRKLSYIETKQGYKQINVTTSSLVKKFYFFPGVDKSFILNNGLLK